MREFTGSEFGRRVNRRTGLGYDQLGQFQFRELLHDILDEFVGFPTGSTVTDGDQADTVLFGQCSDGGHGARPIAAWFVWIDGVGIEQFAGRIDDGKFAAGTNAGVYAHGDVLPSWCCQQEVFEVLAEDADGFFFRLFPELSHQIQFQM